MGGFHAFLCANKKAEEAKILALQKVSYITINEEKFKPISHVISCRFGLLSPMITIATEDTLSSSDLVTEIAHQRLVVIIFGPGEPRSCHPS